MPASRLTELQDFRRDLTKNLNVYRRALVTLAEEKVRLQKEQNTVAHVLLAQETLQKLAQAIQQRSHHQIAKIVSRCLSSIFPNPYHLKIEFVRMRGKTEAILVYEKDGHQVDPLRTSGGVLDISALALRVSELVLSTPQLRKFLVLDEPMKGVSAANLPKAAAMLETLSKEMGIQMLVVTHNEALQCGKVIEL